MGTAHKDDRSLLKPGSPCIIEVDDVNWPPGLWWGTVDAVDEHENYLSVSATITGGRVRFTYGRAIGHPFAPIKNDENLGQKVGTCSVYPDTGSTRLLVRRLMDARDDADKARNAAASWRQTFLDALVYIIKAVTLPPEVQKRLAGLMAGDKT